MTSKKQQTQRSKKPDEKPVGTETHCGASENRSREDGNRRGGAHLGLSEIWCAAGDPGIPEK